MPWCSPYTPMYVPLRTSLRFLSCRAHYPLSCFGTCTLDRIRTCNLDDISILRLPLRHESIFSMMSKNYLLFDYKDTQISFQIQAFFYFFFRCPPRTRTSISRIKICGPAIRREDNDSGVSGIRTQATRRLAVAHPYVLLPLVVDTVGIEPNRSDCKSDGLPLTSGPYKTKNLEILSRG